MGDLAAFAVSGLQSGPDGLDSVVKDNKTLLLLSLEADDPRFCRSVLDAGARTDVFNDHVGAYPVHYAVMRDSLPHLQVLSVCFHYYLKVPGICRVF